MRDQYTTQLKLKKKKKKIVLLIGTMDLKVNNMSYFENFS